jgi:hypothetical protein
MVQDIHVTLVVLHANVENTLNIISYKVIFLKLYEIGGQSSKLNVSFLSTPLIRFEHQPHIKGPTPYKLDKSNELKQLHRFP